LSAPLQPSFVTGLQPMLPPSTTHDPFDGATAGAMHANVPGKGARHSFGHDVSAHDPSALFEGSPDAAASSSQQLACKQSLHMGSNIPMPEHIADPTETMVTVTVCPALFAAWLDCDADVEPPLPVIPESPHAKGKTPTRIARTMVVRFIALSREDVIACRLGKARRCCTMRLVARARVFVLEVPMSLRLRSSLMFVVLVGSVVACSDSQTTATTGTSSGTGAGGASSTASGLATSGTSGECTSSAQCSNGDVCVGGTCCAPKDACDSACCTGGSVCLFDKCITPGKACHTAADCDPGQYCETALGDMGTGGGGGGGTGGAGGGATCTAPIPVGGRCVDLPPVCDANGNPPGCVPACEYHPPVGPLTAVEKWSWGPNNATEFPNFTDVWSTPAVGRVYDANCDGKVDVLDPPQIIFVSGKAIDATTGKGTCCQCTNTTPTSCQTGVLRMLDGRTGQEIWSVDNADPMASGFSGMSTAIGDIDGDGRLDIVAVSGAGNIVMLDATGAVKRVSDLPIPGHANGSFGWGGGLAIADMDGDGFPEIAFGHTVYTTTNNAITLAWTGVGGMGGGGITEALSTFVDLDGAADGHLELLAGNTAYTSTGMVLWQAAGLADGFPGVGDFNKDGKPDAVLVTGGKVYILDGATGVVELGPITLPGNGFGGPPTVADFDGDGLPEIGVAQANFYSVLKPNYAMSKIDLLWSVPNHDLSSSVTGSSVFDFEGDGKSEVIYADECFLWVFDGATGAVRFAAPHTSFTATEASLVADVDGDGRSELLMVSNGADPHAAGWKCLDAAGNPTVVNGVAWTPGFTADLGYRGIAVFGDKANSWVGTRTLWNEHTYHVSNVCDDRDSACDAPNVYGSIPKTEKQNWTLPWLNNFRQNVQDKGLFDAPDATVSLAVPCSSPLNATVSVRNLGLASLPANVNVGVFVKKMPMDVMVGTASTTSALFPGQTSVLDVPLDTSQASTSDTFYAKILIDPNNVTFHQCREDNDQSADVVPNCVQ
jgi:hypothetical protein